MKSIKKFVNKIILRIRYIIYRRKAEAPNYLGGQKKNKYIYEDD